jgi:hypothetical protein
MTRLTSIRRFSSISRSIAGGVGEICSLKYSDTDRSNSFTVSGCLGLRCFAGRMQASDDSFSRSVWITNIPASVLFPLPKSPSKSVRRDCLAASNSGIERRLSGSVISLPSGVKRWRGPLTCMETCRGKVLGNGPDGLRARDFVSISRCASTLAFSRYLDRSEVCSGCNFGENCSGRDLKGSGRASLAGRHTLSGDRGSYSNKR